jgi:excisionase family DNA binding protein
MPLTDRVPAAEHDAHDWLSVGETARMLQLHTDTIYGRVRAGTFPGDVIRIGRVWRLRRSDVEAIAPLVRQYRDLAAADLLDQGDQ